MYYPEANVLVPRDVDPQSKTPAFKAVLVEVSAEPEATDRASAGAGRRIPIAPAVTSS